MFEEDAIQPDVSEEKVEFDPRNLPHSKAMDEIARRLYGDDEPEEVIKENEEDLNKEEVIKEEVNKPIEPPKVKVKIDGEELELPIEEVVKGYQKDKTASKRLEEAARMKAQLEEERKAFLLEREAKRETAAPVDDKAARAKKIYESMMLGDEDQGIKAITEILEGRTEKPIPIEQVTNQAAEQARIQLEYKMAQRQFEKEYSDLVEDDDLKNLAMNYLQKTAPESTSYEEAFKKAGDLTREWVKSKAEKFGFTQKEEATQKKDELKQSLDTVKPANARTPAKKEEREPTMSEVIAEMRKKRGQPV